MRNYAIAGALCLAVMGALFASTAGNPVAHTQVAQAALVSAFDLMVKSRKLPVETFDAV